MLSIKGAVAGAVLGLLLICSSDVPAMTRADSPTDSGKKPDQIGDRASKVKRTTEFMKKIENGFLFTEKNQYSLTGVKVIDRGAGRIGKGFEGKKRVVELIFVNDALHEVIIHK